MRIKSRLQIQGRLTRRALRRYRQSLKYPLSGAPILFANSFPKSGTHLLTQVLAGFAQFGPAVVSGMPAVVTFEGKTGCQRPQSVIQQELERLLPGDIAYGHLHASPGLIDFFRSKHIAHYFILRDPRDVVVSHAHYLTELQSNHILHNYYKYTLTSDEERITASISGINDLQAGIHLPDIRERFEPYISWLDQANVLILRYEDFINLRRRFLESVLNHAIRHNFTASCDHEKALALIEQNINPKKSPTFRSGKIGSWRRSFTEEHRTLFKEMTGDLLCLLDYEFTVDW